MMRGHVLDDVVVGQDEALRVNDEAGADAARGAARVAAQHVEQRVVAALARPRRRRRRPCSATCGAAETVSMLTTAGSTRRAISANEAESASGARAICGRARGRLLVAARRRSCGREHRADADADQEAGRRQRRDPHAELAQDGALRFSRLALRDLQHKTYHLLNFKGAGRVTRRPSKGRGAACSVRRRRGDFGPQWRAPSITNAATRRKEEVGDER